MEQVKDIKEDGLFQRAAAVVFAWPVGQECLMRVGGSWQGEGCAMCPSLQSGAAQSFASVLCLLITAGVTMGCTPGTAAVPDVRAQVPSHTVQDMVTHRLTCAHQSFGSADTLL